MGGDDVVTEHALPWRSVAAVLPEFMSWYVQRYGPIPDDSPGLTRAEYERLRAEYEEES